MDSVSHDPGTRAIAPTAACVPGGVAGRPKGSTLRAGGATDPIAESRPRFDPAPGFRLAPLGWQAGAAAIPAARRAGGRNS